MATATTTTTVTVSGTSTATSTTMVSVQAAPAASATTTTTVSVTASRTATSSTTVTVNGAGTQTTTGIRRWIGSKFIDYHVYQYKASTGLFKDMQFGNTYVPPVTRPAMPTSEPTGFTRQQSLDFSAVPNLPVGSFVVIKNPGQANDGLLASGSAAYTALGTSTIKFYPDGTNDTYNLTQAYPSKVLSVEAAQDGKNALSIYHHTETVAGTSVPMGAWARLLWPDASVSKLYGRMSTCIRSDDTPGYGFVSLIIGSNTQNEMDWFETDLAWATTLGGNHHVGPTNANPGAPHHFPDNGSVLPNLSTWHVCTTEWSPNLVRYLLDGVEIYRSTDAGTTAFKFVNIQTGASNASVVPTASVAGKLRVAWTTIASWNG